MNPYLMQPPCLISFSGGRSSAYMLKMILDAHGGRLPDGIFVVFANTGKEREETLRFVYECGLFWDVPILWVERIWEAPGFAIVNINSASRLGEPFTALIQRRGFLPNAVARFCTIELKIRAMRDFMKAQGFKHWNNVVGLRYDEGRRILKGIARNESGKDPWTTIWPLSKARVTKRDVMSFWVEQPFDLQLNGVEGNCDLCFLKGPDKLLSLIRRFPGMADWWISEEIAVTATARSSGARFTTEYSYTDLVRRVHDQPHFLDLLESDGDEYDVECGLHCDAA